MTIDEFLAQRDALPDAGQWTELVHGMPRSLDPPEFIHGATVMNFSKALGSFLHSNPRGYAVFDVGIVVARSPDTIRFPAVSFYKSGRLFGQADEQITDQAPHWIVDVVSSPDRRQGLGTRIEQFFTSGVELIWVVDPCEKQLATFRPGRRAQTLLPGDTATAAPILDEFEIAVAELFHEPPW